MKYLINGTICEKVAVEGFEYYTTDGKISNEDYVISKDSIAPIYLDGEDLFIGMLDLPQWKKVIATNNSSLDLPQVVSVFEYTKEDMIEFMLWAIVESSSCSSWYEDEELLNVWQEQRIIKLEVK